MSDLNNCPMKGGELLQHVSYDCHLPFCVCQCPVTFPSASQWCGSPHMSPRQGMAHRENPSGFQSRSSLVHETMLVTPGRENLWLKTQAGYVHTPGRITHLYHFLI